LEPRTTDCNLDCFQKPENVFCVEIWFMTLQSLVFQTEICLLFFTDRYQYTDPRSCSITQQR
jgi:hypothetical protein